MSVIVFILFYDLYRLSSYMIFNNNHMTNWAVQSVYLISIWFRTFELGYRIRVERIGLSISYSPSHDRNSSETLFMRNSPSWEQWQWKWSVLRNCSEKVLAESAVNGDVWWSWNSIRLNQTCGFLITSNLHSVIWGSMSN